MCALSNYQKQFKKSLTISDFFLVFIISEILAGFSTGGGLLSLLVCSFWLYKVFKRRREIKIKQKFFKKKNGGLLLQ